MATITSLGFNIRSDWDGSGVKSAVSDLQLLQEEMRRVSGAALSVDVVVETDGPNGIGAARRELDMLEDKMRRISGAALNIHVHVDGMDEISQAQLRLEALNAEARSVRIGFELNMFEYTAAEVKIARLVRDRTVRIDINHGGLDEGIMKITNNFHESVKGSEDFQTRATRAMVMVRLAMMGVLAAGGLLPSMFVAIGAAISVIPGIAAVALGGALLSRVQSVKDAFTGLKDTILEIGDDAVKPMVQPVLEAVERMKAALWTMQPAIKEMFGSAANLVRPLSDTLIAFAQRVMPGVNDMLRESVPLFNGIQEGVKNFATSVSRMFSAMSTATEDFGMTFNILFTYTGRIMEAFGQSTARMAGDVNQSMGNSFRSFEGFITGMLDGMEGFSAATAQVNGGLNIFRTLGDMLRIILPAWGELYAAIGLTGGGINNLGTGIATFIAGAMTSLADIITKVSPYINQFAFYLGKGFEALSQLTPILGPAAAGIWLINHAVKANPLVMFAVAIVAVIGYLYDLEQRTGAVSAFIKSAWETIGPVIMPVVNTIRDGINDIKGAFDSAGGASGVWDKIVQAMQPIIDVIKQLVDTYLPQIKQIGSTFMEAFAPLWEKIKPALSDLWTAVQDMWTQIQPFVIALGGVIGALFGGVLGAVNGMIKPAIEILVSIFNGIVGVVTNVVQVVSGLFQFLGGMITMVINIGKAIAAIFTGNGEALKNAFGGIKTSISNIFGGLTNAIQGVAGIIANIWNTIVGVFKNGIALVIGAVTGFIQGVINFFTRMWDVLVGHSIVPDMINAIIKWFLELPGKLIGMVSQFIQNIINFFVDLATRLVDTWRGWIDMITNAWNTFAGWIRAAWDAAWNYLKAAFDAWSGAVRAVWDAVWNAVRAVWDAFANFIRAAWDALWNGIKAVGETIWNAIKSFWDNFINGIKVIWEAFKTFISDAWTGLWEGIKDTAQRIWDWISQQFSNFRDNVQGTIQGLVDKVKEIWEKITSVFQGPIDAVKGIWNGVAGAFGLPQLAVGGPVEAQKLATGGTVRGKGTGTSDDIPAMLSNGEHVWTAREVDAAGGHDNVIKMRQQVLKGGDPQYLAAGGPALDWMVGQQQQHAPALQLTSGVRNEPGSYHHTGQAGDFSNAGTQGSPEMKAFAGWIANTWGRQTLELIHSPFDHNIGDGVDVGNGMGSYYGAGTMADHLDHVHWAVPHALDDSAMGAAVVGVGGGGRSGPTQAQIDQINKAKDEITRVMRDSQREALTNINYAQMKYAFNPGSGGYVGQIPTLSDDYGKNADILAAMGVADAVPPSGTVKQGVGAMGKLDEALARMSSAGAASMGGYGTGYRFYVDEIEAAAKERGLDRRAAKIGVGTALVESNLKMYANNAVPESLNFPHDAVGNDHDSVGLFQQRDNGAWGTVAQRMNPRASAGMFFNALINSGNWNGLTDNDAAQNVQRSGVPNAYGPRMAEADQLIGEYAKGTRSAASGWSMVGERGPEMVKFSGGETVKTFDEIIAKLKETTAGNVDALKTRIGVEFEAAIKKLIDANKGDGAQMRAALEKCVREAVAATGMKFDIQSNGANVEDLVRQIVPQLTAFIQQGVGRIG